MSEKTPKNLNNFKREGRILHSRQALGSWLFSQRARPVRFICTGGFAGLIQLMLLHLWTHQGWNPVLANLAAFSLAAQVNFLLSSLFTWRDRRQVSAQRTLLLCWLTFHSTIVGTASLNQMTFLLARLFLPDLGASALGIGLAALINFVLLNRLVFHPTTSQKLPLSSSREDISSSSEH